LPPRPLPPLCCRCFSEWLRPATSLPAFLRQDLFGPGGVTRFPSAEARLGALKRVFAQGLAIIRLLRAAGVTHNDLLLMNMLVRRHDKDSFQLAVSLLAVECLADSLVGLLIAGCGNPMEGVSVGTA
jgi:hypothetical protein